jgi:hypothetical protein
VRRDYRRIASRLRKGKLEPRYRNLHTPEGLADILERTARRDEMIEQGLEEFRRLSLELGSVLEENDPDVLRAIRALVRETARAAEEQGPGSEAARQYRCFQFLRSFGLQWHAHHRRGTFPASRPMPPLAMDPSVEARYEATAAEILDPTPGQAVPAIPPDGRCFGWGRLLLRIGVGEASWICCFARGQMGLSTVSMMPGDRQLFVSATGAGYIIDRESRMLVEQVGTDVARVLLDESRTVFVIDHKGVFLEAFGRSGRLWKTKRIGCGGFRNLTLTAERLAGEARQPYPKGWAGFSVEVATGEVQFGAGE